MRRNRNNEQTAAPGEDSFLDVVANLVGILIILVMVIGAQAHESWQKSAEMDVTAQAELEKITQQSEKARREAGSMQTENVELERLVKEEELSTKLLSAERDAMQVAILQLERKIEHFESEKSDDDRARLAAQNELAKRQLALDELQRKIAMASADESAPQTIEHYPSPIAKTVFGEELHFRLAGGKVAYVPMQELVGLVKSEIELKGRSLKSEQETSGTVGPIEGFRMQYLLSALEITRRVDQYVVRQKVAQVEEVQLLPTRNDIGETLAAALADGGRFQQRITQADPHNTTISIWVYPDSYAEFRDLKDILAKRGFLSAAWPLPFGQPISGSPNGAHSAAQ